MSRIFWDTNLFIYLFEDYRDLSAKTVELRRKMNQRGDQLLTSTMTLGEILVRPVQRGDQVMSQKYEEMLTATAIVVPFDRKAARVYAALRADRSLKAPDALQLSCAASVGVDLFITNDNHLQGKIIPGIQFISSVDRVPL